MSDWLGRYSNDKQDLFDKGPAITSPSDPLPYTKNQEINVKKISTGYVPRPLQQVIHTHLKRFNVLVCHRRFGKCIAEGTKITTRNGIKPIEEVWVGDEVVTVDGSFTRVKASASSGLQQLHRVKFDDGSYIDCDPDHPWYVEKPLHQMAKTKRSPFKYGVNIKTSDIQSALKDGQLFVPCMVNGFDGTHRDLPVDPYLLGYWLGDGASDYGSIYVCKGDEHTLPEGNNVEDRGSHYRISYKGLVTKLRDLNLYKNKHIPEIYKLCSRSQRKELIRGLMDSDGTVSSSGTCRFDNKNETLIDDFIYLASSLGIKVTKKQYKKRKEFYCLFRKRDFPCFKLDRKENKAEYSGRPIRRQIVSVEILDETKHCYCIAVEDESKIFMASDNFIPVCNTILVINEMINKGLENKKHNPQYAYIAPTYKQAKMIAWEYLIDYTSEIPGVKVNKSELTVEIYREGTKDASGRGWKKKPDKIKFMLLGSDNPDSIRGVYLDGAILDEFAQCDPIIWGEVVRPALADRKGWAIFIGTPKGQNHFYHRLVKAQEQPDNWYTQIYKASETGVLPESEIEDMKADMDAQEIEQELECSFHAAVRGSYYGDNLREIEENGQIDKIMYNPRYPVDTHWDLGIGDSTAIVFRQKINGYFHYIDYLEANGKGVEWYIKELEKKPYIYGRMVWPHDGKNKDFITGQTRLEVVKELKPEWKWEVLTKQAVDDGIQAVRRRLPISRFDKDKCARLLDCLKNYQREWDGKLMMFKDKPKHDWTSHGADAFRYDSLDDRDTLEINRRREKLANSFAESDYDELGY